jgi:hypothetical protein
MSIEKVISNAKTTTQAFNSFASSNPADAAEFRKFYHLRPTSGGVTIVTTHPDFPLRGITVAKTKLFGAVADILKSPQISAVETGGKQFHKGTKNGKNEYPLQARFINDINGGSLEIREKLGCKNLYFIGSEIILQEGTTSNGKKIDVVAADNLGRVYFVELKSNKNKSDNPYNQVREYLDIYGKDGSKNKDMEDLLENYPNYSLPKITEFIGVVVKGDKDQYSVERL